MNSVSSSVSCQTPLLSVSALSKKFGANVVLSDFNFELRRREVHALLGENGAGKSTLINMIVGALAPDAGSLEIDGVSLGGRGLQRIRQLGISAVFQEFSLAPNLTVEENLFLGRELSRWGRLDRAGMRSRCKAILHEMQFDVAGSAVVGNLSRSEQQMVEIAKAALTDPRVLILDEPTASLTDVEAARLFSFVRKLRTRGVGLIYVSHRLAEIRALADRVTVMRDGRNVMTVGVSDVTDPELIQSMTGRPIELVFPPIPLNAGKEKLRLSRLTLADGRVKNVNLAVRAGEVVGIAGLVGCGKSQLARAVFGLEAIAEGIIAINGTPVKPTPGKMLASAICYFTSDRNGEGLALNRSVRENMSITSVSVLRGLRTPLIRPANERKAMQAIARQLRIRPTNIEIPVGSLSGGNRQKVSLSRGFATYTDVFLLDEPTVGVDVGAKLEIYSLIQGFVEKGAAVVLISSDLSEILHLAHRCYVMRQSRVVAELSGKDMTESTILHHFFHHATEAVSPTEEGGMLQ